jgi:hypothetical protein
MHHFKPWRFLLAILLTGSLSVLAQQSSEPLKSDWLELVKGYKSESDGVQLQNIEEGDEPGSQTITLSIPKKYLADPDAIEEVVVIGKRPEKPKPLLDVEYEWVDDYDNDNYGLVIRLGKNSNWPIRLFFYSDPGFVR